MLEHGHPRQVQGVENPVALDSIEVRTRAADAFDLVYTKDETMIGPTVLDCEEDGVVGAIFLIHEDRHHQGELVRTFRDFHGLN